MRHKGVSIKDIARILGVAQSSVSLWVRDIELLSAQKERLDYRRHAPAAIKRRRETRLVNESARRQKVIDAATEDIKAISKETLFLIGSALYWAEGTKSVRGIVGFSNSDPRLIQIIVKFFKETCSVPPKKMRAHVFLHPHLDAHKAERYWSNVSGIPRKQFHKTTQQHNKASKGCKDSLPHGTLSVEVYNTELFLKLQGWMQGMHQKITQM